MSRQTLIPNSLGSLHKVHVYIHIINTSALDFRGFFEIDIYLLK